MEPSAAPVPPTSALYDAAACGLACTTDDGVFLAVNQTLCDWLGRSRDELVGRLKLQDLLTMGGRIFHQTHWAPLLRIQGSISEVKLEIAPKGGSAPIPMVMNAIRRERDGVWFHEVAVIVARDRDAYERELIASRRKLEQMVAEARQLHEEAKDRALFAEQMMGIVSHDLRNPLSTIQMSAALLTRSSANQEAVLGRVTRAAERANRLIADLLDFTQARLGRGISITRAPVDLRQCIAEAVEDLAQAHPGRQITHTHTGSVSCEADCHRLVQLVGNLVSNALAYGRPDTPVQVVSQVGEASFEVAVGNAGEPIPPELQQALFQPMVRGHVDASTRSVGLGLYIVSEITKAHGGEVSVFSTAQAGTTFRAVFPLGAPPPA